MAENEYTETEEISRDYVDNFSFKQMVLDDLMPKYFEEETSNLTVGLTGLLTEMGGQITEDGFNTSSTLLMETFPTRAKMKNSIYSNAAIFQLSNVFADSARCDFLIVLSEDDVIRNFKQEQGGRYNYFYLDKDTKIYVDKIPFVLDYDIVIRAIYKETQGGYVYSAKYDMSEYTNTISPIKDPYIKIRKTKNKLLVLQVNMGQYTRKVLYESIIDNVIINFPTITVPYVNKICGLDVLYKKPTESTFNTQLALQVRFSQPSKSPFCYYRKLDNETLELSFTTKDTYFQPEFNSELMIVVYSTEGEDGNFDKYDGENVSLIKSNEKYQYPYSWAVSTKPISSSEGGKEALTDEGLQALTVEGFSTANALTTEHDLQVYFNNYKHRYGAEVLFLKKRDDTAERLFSAFLYVKKQDYFYPTNTLSLNTNILKFDEKDGGFYNMEPGFLFSYEKEDIYRVLRIYYIVDEDGTYYDTEGKKHNKDGSLDGTSISLEDLNKKIKAGDVKQNPDQYYVLVNDTYVLKNPDGDTAKLIYQNPFDGTFYKATTILPEKVFYHFDKDMKDMNEDPLTESDINELIKNQKIIPYQVDEYNDPLEMTESDLFLKFRSGGLTYDMMDIPSGMYIDYIRDEEAELQNRYDYLNYYEEYMNIVYYPTDKEDETYYQLVSVDGDKTFYHYNKGTKDRVDDISYTEVDIQDMEFENKIYPDVNNKIISMADYIFNFSFNDFKKTFGRDTRVKVFNENIAEIAKNYKFLFTNPFLMSITKSSGLIGYYMTAVSQDSVLDFMDQNDADAFIQFITYTLHLSRKMSDDHTYHFSLTVLPSVSVESDDGMINDENLYDIENDALFPEQTENATRDLMSYNRKLLEQNNLRVVLTFYDENKEKLLGYMEMVPTFHDKSTDQITFEADFLTDDYVTTDNLFRVTHRCPYCGHEIYNSVNTKDEEFKYFYQCDSCGKEFTDGFVNIREIDDIWLPITDAQVDIIVLYNDPNEEVHPTNNDFYRYDEGFANYHWTNRYATIMNSLTFIQPMNLLRSNIEYQDYHQTGVQALDCYIRNVPFLKYSIIAYQDEGPLITDSLEEDDVQKFDYFLTSYTNHYKILDEAKMKLCNNMNIDTKFYNTYGKSTNFIIGEEGELIDTVNIRIKFIVYLITNTDQVNAESELKTYIKEYIESINSEGTNDLYISNLIRGIENTFGYVHHLYFKGINDYPVSYQAIKNKAISLVDLSKEERRHFVPDLLTINRANIDLKFEEVDE